MIITPGMNHGEITRYCGNNSKHGTKTVNSTANGDILFCYFAGRKKRCPSLLPLKRI
jgi:hypothetical protein